MIYKLLLFLFLFFGFSSVYCEERWENEEREILLTAERENLPIVAFFLGGTWCPWSQKFTNEIFKSSVFQSKVGKEAILWEIALAKESQDDAMRQKYGVTECPQILILDPKGKEFARMSYVPLIPSEFGEGIVSFINDFHEICSALDQKQNRFEEEQWKDLFVKAKRLSATCYKQVILERGLKKEKGNFFHLEKYASMLEKYKTKHPEVLKLKSQVLKRDSNNIFGTHFKVALLEFGKIAAGLKTKERTEKALKPLLKYVQGVGKKDPENLWKAEMMIAEFLFGRNAASLGLQHAETALKVAPVSAEEKIQEVIAFMKGVE